MFESYQQEAKAAKDRKDKEEIELLRNQVNIRTSVFTITIDLHVALV